MDTHEADPPRAPVMPGHSPLTTLKSLRDRVRSGWTPPQYVLDRGGLTQAQWLERQQDRLSRFERDYPEVVEAYDALLVRH